MEEFNPTYVERIAKVAHEINRAYCNAIGDNSQPTWEDAPDWQKDSARNGVMFHINNPGVTPEQSHENWLNQKREEGWKWGVKKNPEKKEHPCFTAYQFLPTEQKVKDYLFKAVIEQLK